MVIVAKYESRYSYVKFLIVERIKRMTIGDNIMKYEKRVNMRIPTNVYELLIEIATMEDKSLSMVVREVLAERAKKYRQGRDCE